MEQLLNTWAVREVVRPALDVLVLAWLLYKSWQILVQTRAVQLIKGTVVMVLIYAGAFFLRLTTQVFRSQSTGGSPTSRSAGRNR